MDRASVLAVYAGIEAAEDSGYDFLNDGDPYNAWGGTRFGHRRRHHHGGAVRESS